MIKQSTLQFLKDLKKNNKKVWFDANRNRFDDARKNFEEFTSEVIARLGKIDETIAHLEARECTFRQHRDVRFSKDKSPYKVNMGLYLSKGGRKGKQAGYYLHLEPGGSFTGGGLWIPMAPELKRVRQELDYNWEEFRSIISSKKFKSVYGDLESGSDVKLSRPPKGYEPSNKAIEYLKLKTLIASVKLQDSELTSKDLPKKVVSYFQTLKPMIDFLNRAVEDE
jgi:uncharacterized protein (TIGR02453 family)